MLTRGEPIRAPDRPQIRLSSGRTKVEAATVSPYLQQSIRTMRQACMEIAADGGAPPPDCKACRNRKTCLLMERRFRREQKREYYRRIARARVAARPKGVILSRPERISRE